MPKDTRNPADLYKAVMDATQRYVAGVPEDNWTNRTPCDEWDVLDVVNHVVRGNLWLGELFKGKTIEEVGDVFEVDTFVHGHDPRRGYPVTHEHRLDRVRCTQEQFDLPVLPSRKGVPPDVEVDPTRHHKPWQRVESAERAGQCHHGHCVCVMCVHHRRS